MKAHVTIDQLRADAVKSAQAAVLRESSAPGRVPPDVEQIEIVDVMWRRTRTASANLGAGYPHPFGADATDIDIVVIGRTRGAWFAAQSGSRWPWGLEERRLDLTEPTRSPATDLRRLMDDWTRQGYHPIPRG